MADLLISWEEALDLLKQGKCIAYPTDTVWGIGCLADDAARVQRCLAHKGDDRHAVSSVILPLSRIGPPYVDIPQDARFQHVLPGMYTFILPTAEGCPLLHIAGDGPSLGVRVPDLPDLNRMVDALGGPLLTTSLNFHGEPPCTNLEQAREVARRMGIPCVNNEHTCVGVSSSVLKWNAGSWQVIREGAGSISAVTNSRAAILPSCGATAEENASTGSTSPESVAAA